jgi:hypothetical protein
MLSTAVHAIQSLRLYPLFTTIEDVNSLRADTGLPSSGSTDAMQMVQLLRHLSCGCVMVQPDHDTTTLLNAAAGGTRYITVAMEGSNHVEPVVLNGTVQVRTL